MRPNADPSAPPAHSISDATHSSGNPDFFFLPPMVKDPSASPDWNAGAFNGALKPTVTICSLPGTTEGSITPTTACVATITTGTATANLTDESYQLNWQVPISSTTFYRIRISVGATTLGWADVETASSSSQLKNVNTGDFVPLNDGRTLPIKFRIERYALCTVPGVGPCGSATIDLSSGGTVSTVLPNGSESSGISFPPQDPGSPSDGISTTVTVQACDTFNPRATDLPVFGPCARITADPALPPSGLTNAATVFICDVSDLTITQGPGGQVLDHDQADRITLHRLDPDPNTPGSQIVTALPHAPACGPNTASRNASFSGLFAALRHGELRQAVHQVAGLLSPTPLYAARYIDLGGGGFTVELSDFQFALPAKMEIVPATNGQTGDLGSLLPLFPAVKVTDVSGSPVRNAHVHFATTDGSVTTNEVTTDETGLAQVGWTLGSALVEHLTANGRGLAGTDVNGPRRSMGSQVDDIVDPFQPIQSYFDNGAPSSGPVLVRTGSVVFSAIGRPFATSFEPVDASWLKESTQGFWHTSTLSGITDAAYPNLVNAPAGDNSPGALPAPFAGANALWFGEDARGNYAGELADPNQPGGTSTAPRSGIAASPVFVVPSGSNAVQLSFESWFEIESVNPSGYDVMQVRIADLDANTSTVLARLNPSTDPGGNASTPLTSGGFDAPPVWVKITADLSPYRGHRVQLTFSFDTVDPLYNGFRGWVVDDVALSVLTTPVVATRIPLVHADVVNTSPPPTRTWHP